jgi:hypothetical protein
MESKRWDHARVFKTDSRISCKFREGDVADYELKLKMSKIFDKCKMKRVCPSDQASYRKARLEVKSAVLTSQKSVL